MPEAFLVIIEGIFLIVALVGWFTSTKEARFRFLWLLPAFLVVLGILWSFAARDYRKNAGGYPIESQDIYKPVTELLSDGTSFQYIKVYGDPADPKRAMWIENMSNHFKRSIPEDKVVMRTTYNYRKTFLGLLLLRLDYRAEYEIVEAPEELIR